MVLIATPSVYEEMVLGIGTVCGRDGSVDSLQCRLPLQVTGASITVLFWTLLVAQGGRGIHRLLVGEVPDFKPRSGHRGSCLSTRTLPAPRPDRGALFSQSLFSSSSTVEVQSLNPL